MDISKDIKKILLDEETSSKELAEKLGISPQSLSAKLIRNNLRVSEIQEIADALGYEVEINFKKK